HSHMRPPTAPPPALGVVFAAAKSPRYSHFLKSRERYSGTIPLVSRPPAPMIMYQSSPSFHRAGSRQSVIFRPGGGAAITGFSGIFVHLMRFGSFGSTASATIWRSGISPFARSARSVSPTHVAPVEALVG